jgi:primase-polymerase (primpol)-like protein
VNDPKTWGTFERACAAAKARRYDGIGYVFNKEDDYVGVDLDACVDDDGNISAEAQAIIDKIGSYAEFSVVKGGAKLRRVAGRSNSAAPSARLSENVCRTAASVAAGMDIGQEAPRCTATWINGLTFVAGFWSRR